MYCFTFPRNKPAVLEKNPVAPIGLPLASLERLAERFAAWRAKRAASKSPTALDEQ